MKKVIFVFNSELKKLEYVNFIQDVHSYGHQVTIEVFLAGELLFFEEENLVFCETRQDFGEKVKSILLSDVGVHEAIQEISTFLC